MGGRNKGVYQDKYSPSPEKNPKINKEKKAFKREKEKKRTDIRPKRTNWVELSPLASPVHLSASVASAPSNSILKSLVEVNVSPKYSTPKDKEKS